MGFRTALFTSALFLAFMAQSVLATTQVLTEANFDEQTKDDVWFVKFYAPWCGHCQKLAPVIDQLSEDSVITEADAHVAKVDCTTERSICERFGVQSYPTLKVVSGGRFFDYAGPRDIATLAKFTVTGHKTALSEKVLSYPEFVAQREMAEREQLEAESTSQVVTLTSTNFDELVKASKDPWIIKFYAPWCGHCKSLAPIYEEVAKIFGGEENVLVAKVDATAHADLASRYGVNGYPTIKYFAPGSDDPEDYSGGRDKDSFIEFLNEHAGTHRTSTGELSAEAGRVKEIDVIISATGEITSSVLEQAESLVEKLEGDAAKHGNLYIKAMKKVIAKGDKYVQAEIKRLEGLLANENVTAQKKKLFALRKNILEAFTQKE